MSNEPLGPLDAPASRVRTPRRGYREPAILTAAAPPEGRRRSIR